MTGTCKTHPSYQAKRRPTSQCVECHSIWHNKQLADSERFGRERESMDIKRRMFRRGRMKV